MVKTSLNRIQGSCNMHKTRLHSTVFAFLLAASAFSLAQEPGLATPSVAVSTIGAWSGDWRNSDGRFSGSMIFEIDVKGDRVTGRAKAGNVGRCSDQWQELTGTLKDGKVQASYNLGGPCGKVDLILTVESDATAMTGTWKSEYPSYGTYALRKVTAARP